AVVFVHAEGEAVVGSAQRFARSATREQAAGVVRKDDALDRYVRRRTAQEVLAGLTRDLDGAQVDRATWDRARSCRDDPADQPAPPAVDLRTALERERQLDRGASVDHLDLDLGSVRLALDLQGGLGEREAGGGLVPEPVVATVGGEHDGVVRLDLA